MAFGIQRRKYFGLHDEKELMLMLDLDLDIFNKKAVWVKQQAF